LARRPTTPARRLGIDRHLGSTGEEMRRPPERVMGP
jgi:hypothetical protein